jgi:hypothetical protein
MKAKLLTGILLLLTVNSCWGQRPAPKRLTANQLQQLADILFRVPGMEDVKIIRFRYAIADVEQGEIIEVLYPQTRQGEPEDFDVFRYSGGKCIKLAEENWANVWRSPRGKRYVDDVYQGGVRAREQYNRDLRQLTSTPLFVFHRRGVPHTCATLDLMTDPVVVNSRSLDSEAREAKRSQQAAGHRP